jgi:hypothetical protein
LKRQTLCVTKTYTEELMIDKLILRVKDIFLIIKNIKQINKDKPKIIFFQKTKHI